jgi:hypothetical protein
MTTAKFHVDQILQHRKGGLYRIVRTPDARKLEYCAEAFYEYESLQNNTIWLRCQSEMEDGRFVLVNQE